MPLRTTPALLRPTAALGLASLVALTGLVGAAESAPREMPRDPFLQPFASHSLWNTSLGAGARWSRPSDPDTRDLRGDIPGINAGEWSMPYFIGRDTDRRVTFRDRDAEKPVAPQRLPAPASIHPALPRDGDRHIIIFDPGKRHMSHYFGCNRTGDGFDCALAQRDDVCGDGLGGYGWGTGVMRRWEIAAGRIDHMLRFSLPVTRTRSGGNGPGDAWPARGEDGFGPTRYAGQVLFGSTIGLPADVDIAALDLSPSGEMLARTLQDYGALMRDTGGEHGIIFYAEEAAEGMPQLADMRADLAKIVPHLAILRNQSSATPNGGGTRRQPPLPPVDPRICAAP